jgi:hypothetical protein
VEDIMRYHISPTTGNPNICRAQPGNCPFGAEEPHYTSKEDARVGYEELQKPVASPLKKQQTFTLRIDQENGYLTPEWAEQVKLQDVSCPRCGKETPPAQMTMLINNDWAYCSCGRRYDINEMKVELTPNNPSYRFLDKEEVKATTWYHATSRDDWLEANDDGDAFAAHVGTEAAAFDRAISEYARRDKWGKNFILYEVKLQDEVTIADEIDEDEDKQQVGEGGNDVVRYVNRWEDTASVSLTVISDKLTIVSKREVTKNEAHSRLSVYNIPLEEIDEGFEDAYTGSEGDEAYAESLSKGLAAPKK